MQLTLPSSSVDYDLYERIVASSLGVTTDQSAAAATSILPRSCRLRNIKFPDVSPNTTILIIKESTGSELTRIALDESYQVQSTYNNIPLIGIKLRGPVANALVDVDIEVA